MGRALPWAAFILAALAGRARADPEVTLRVPPPPRATTSQQVVSERDAGPPQRCVPPCTLLLAPGPYTAFLDGARPSHFRFSIERDPARPLRLKYERVGLHRAGLALLISGAAVAAAAILASAITFGECFEGPCAGTADQVFVPAGAFGLSAVLALVTGAFLLEFASPGVVSE
jgi:hypothetical protein